MLFLQGVLQEIFELTLVGAVIDVLDLNFLTEINKANKRLSGQILLEVAFITDTEFF